MKLELVTRKSVSHVELEKDEKYCLGITISDATKDEAGPVVKKVRLKGPAGKSYAIDQGDVILSLNGYSMVGTKSKEIIRMIKGAGKVVDFKLQYKIRELRVLDVLQPCVYRKQQRKIELHKMKDGFGFILRKNDPMHSFAEEYPVISNIKEGSHIYRDGRLFEGDRLLRVDEVNLSWLSLPDISCLLQAKNKAIFTFEYNVAVLDFSETGVEVDLDIDVPTADLGMSLSTDSEESGFMYIKSIRLGSIAERCGLFCEGDIILSVNEIDTKFLTVSKASMLLENSKKCRKISFIPSRRYGRSFHEKDITVNCGSKERDTVITSSYSDQACHDRKHVNTPASSNIAFPVKQGNIYPNLVFSEQIKSISKLRNIVRVMRNLKQILSQLTSAAFEKRPLTANESCALCHESQQTGKLCASYVAKINQSMDELQTNVTNFVAYSSSLENEHFPGTIEENMKEMWIDESISKVSKGEVVHILDEILPIVFSAELGVKEDLQALAKKVTRADESCNICDYEVKFVWIIVQKLMLLLSLKGNRSDIKPLINQLLGCLINTEFSCGTLSDCSSSCVDDHNCLPSPASFADDASLLESNANTTQTIVGSESVEIRNSVISGLNIPLISMEKDYLKIIHIQSLSESGEFRDGNDLCDTDMHSKSFVDDDWASLEVNYMKSASISAGLENTAKGSDEKIYKDKGLSLTPAKLCRSLDSIFRPSKTAKEQPQIPKRCAPNPSKCIVTNLNGTAKDAPSTSSNYPTNHLTTDRKPKTNEEKPYDSNDESTPSSFAHSSQKGSRTYPRKIRTDTIEVKLINTGEGFGLILGARFNTAKSSVIPIIRTIKPKSPAQRSGILKVEDRIIAINHRSTLGLPLKELQTLNKRCFSADAITLTVEFDIVEAELKIGTFDVVLDKMLKIGLVFEDMKRGYPMVVSGIAKGSGSHRCGQLFPGDKVKFFRCIRNEEFDPVSCNYTKEESVLITVQRDRIQGFQEKSATSSPCYLNPCFSHKDSVPRRGSRFVVKSSSIHVLEGTEVLVLDQEVTLYRDPVLCDFGFLIGENPETGHAYVTGIRPDGPACESGVIRKFDRIIEVNGFSVDKKVENSVLSLLSQVDHKVDLLIRRLYHEDPNRV